MKKNLTLTLLALLFLANPSVNPQGPRSADRLKDRDRVVKPRPTPVPVANTPQPPTSAGVRVFGDWFPTGHCDFTLNPRDGYQGLPNPACNDTTSGVDVPFGMSLEICEHDGQGSPGLGKCRRFLPGRSGVGDDMNDKGTSYKVEKRMFGYLNSADYPTGISIMIGVSGQDPGVGPLSPTGKISYDGTWINQENHIPFSSSCRNPTVVEITRSGDAEWGRSITNNTINTWMRVRPKAPFGANNWVGIEIVCH